VFDDVSRHALALSVCDRGVRPDLLEVRGHRDESLTQRVVDHSLNATTRTFFLRFREVRSFSFQSASCVSATSLLAGSTFVKLRLARSASNWALFYCRGPQRIGLCVPTLDLCANFQGHRDSTGRHGLHDQHTNGVIYGCARYRLTVCTPHASVGRSHTYHDSSRSLESR
jgi:hypothetical protein